MKVLILEDEPLAQEVLKAYVAKIPELKLIQCCKNADEAYHFFQTETIDLLFIDIHLPKIDGITFLRGNDIKCKIIFTTAYPNYAIQGYEFNTVDYLVKPFSFERFKKAIDKITELHLNTTPESQFIFLRHNGSWKKIDIYSIALIEGLKDYLKLYLTSNEQLVIYSTMKNFETQLQKYECFLRVHKSFIVNLQCVKSYNYTELQLLEKNIPIGITYKEIVKQQLFKHFGK